MKRNFFWFLSIVLVSATFTLTSCEDDPCKDVDCGVGGDCFEGTCICKEGYISDGFGGCIEDPCFDKVCGSNSTCVDGDCICDAGYEKNAQDSCVLERAKFVGTYTVSDDCSSSGTATYIVTAIAGASDNMVAISNFWNVFNNPVVATVDGDALTIANQDPDSDGFTVEGSGTYSNGTITMSYTITDTTVTPNDVDNCNSTWVKN
ncbi:MAG: hypothetical protein R2769_16945 [Saprospiraceae bacterium]